MCRVASQYVKSKLELPTQELIDLIFSDAMFQEAMQVQPPTSSRTCRQKSSDMSQSHALEQARVTCLSVPHMLRGVDAAHRPLVSAAMLEA